MISFSLQGSPEVEVYNLRSYTHPSHTRIVLDIGKLREYSFNRLSNPDRFYVDIYQVKLNPILHEKTSLVENGYIQRIRIAQRTSTSVRMVIDCDFQKVKRFNVFHLPDPYRVVIDVYPVQSKLSSPGIKISRPPDPSKEGYSLVRQLGLGINKVVIDPGHGGKDPGCLGKKGSMEKDIVLDVSLRLKKLLEGKNGPGLEVILTRESDIFLPLESRPVIANQKECDLFISVHANANPSRRFSGVQTFYLNFSTDDTVIAIAARENATSKKTIHEMKDMIKKIAQHSWIVESKDLAEKIQANLVDRLNAEHKNVKNLGVKGGPFWVLSGSEMPSILVEISHLSNSTEESRLSTPQYRQDIAQGIFNGIIEYIHSLGKG